MKVEQLAPDSSRAVTLQAILRAEAEELPFLVVSPAGGGQRIVLLEQGDEALWVGRSPACDVALDTDGQASRTHAELVRAGGDWAVADDGLSRNGTFVGAERVVGRRRLQDGDVISVGESTLAFRAPRSAVAATTLAGDRLPARPDVTPAQRRVLVALCRPLLADPPGPTPASNREIAAELVLSDDAVRTHLKALFERARVADLAQGAKRVRLAEIAIATGIVGRHDVE
ncbi:FHA domain-containing protein [Patulibacter minatonensis]|uniref:FHA domain-containing protein n=1 Tax=Patulibacter minatonensis TaxID=298163 RepID=UPI0004B9259D|nr:FHA domain-containing protein [Patulibacter minatonensis]